MIVPAILKKIAAASIAAVMLMSSALAADVRIGTINTGALKLRSEASTDGKVLSTAYQGEKLVILDTSGDWFKVLYNNTEGYMFSQYLTVQNTAVIDLGSGEVTGTVVNVRKEPNSGAPIICQLVKGKTVSVLGVSSGWYAVRTQSGKEGYIHGDYIKLSADKDKPAQRDAKSAAAAASEEVIEESDDGIALSSGDVSQTRADLIAFSKTFLGVKYKYGGASPSGFDCSGFAYYVFGKFGYTLGRSSSQQLNNGVKVSKDELKPGDLVFFKNPNEPKKPSGHTGIYVGGGNFIHSSSPGDVVKITPMSDSYYLKNYVGARRIIKD